MSQKKGRVKPIKIKVIGVGGGGATIVKSIASKLGKVDFLAANTDSRSLERLGRKLRTFLFGEEVTFGLGTGMKPELAEKAALEAKNKFRKLLKNADFCIFIACLGGGTGSGATPIFLKTAKEAKILTLTIVTIPFKFEGSQRKKISLEALEKLKRESDALTVISNENIFKVVDPKSSFYYALSVINNLLKESISSLIGLIYNTGLINLDLADLKSILKRNQNLTYFQTKEFSNSETTEKIVQEISYNPLYDYDLKGAKRILLNICASEKLPMRKAYLIAQEITRLTPQAKIIFGLSLRKTKTNKTRISVLATGCQSQEDLINEKKAKKKKKTKKTLKDEKQKAGKKEKEEKKEKKKPKKIRKSPLEIKKEQERLEKKLLLFDDELEIPAFLRRKIKSK